MSKRPNDKQLINTFLMEASKLLKAGDLVGAERKLNSALPTVRRVDFGKTQIFTMLSLVTFKLGKLDDAYKYAEEELTIHPTNDKMFKIQLDVLHQKKDNKKLIEKTMKCLEVCEHTDMLLQLVSKFLEDLEDDTLTEKFISIVKTLPLENAAKYYDFIPEDDDLRVQIAEIKFPEDPIKYSDFIYEILDRKDYTKTLTYARMLPEDNADRLNIETLLGEDPMKYAKMHIDLGKDKFKVWYEAAQAKDYRKINGQLHVTDNFISGYIYLLKQPIDSKTLIDVCREIEMKYSCCPSLLKEVASVLDNRGYYEDAKKFADMLAKFDPVSANGIVIKSYIHLGDINKVEAALKKGIKISDELQCLVCMMFFNRDKKDEHLLKLLELEDSKEVAKLKTEALCILGDRIDADKANAIFAAQVKLCGKEQPEILANYGIYLKDVLNEQQKGDLLLKRAVSLGYVSEESLRISTEELIKDGKIDEALEQCLKLKNSKWAHLRAGLIYFQRHQFEAAAQQLKAHISLVPDSVEGLNALCYTYFLLNKLMAAFTVLENLRSIGHPNIELEARFNLIHGVPLSMRDVDLHLDETPLLFEPYILQAIERIQRFWVFGRHETCISIVKEIEPFVSQYKEKWGTLTTVLKQCGDFYVQAFTVTSAPEYIKLALTSFMKRAELDKRGECFIDVALALNLTKASEKALLVLKRAIRAFPDNMYVWLNLGITYAITDKLPYARHCLSVAAMMADNVDKATIFGCCAAIAMIIGDDDLFDKATDQAHIYNPNNASLWELRANSHQYDKYSAETISFMDEATETSILTLADVCIRENRPQEALGYAFMSGDRKRIEAALEANKQYKAAANYADDEETKERLRFLIDNEVVGEPKNPLISAVSMFTNGDYDGASKEFIKMNNIFSIFGAAACAMKKGKRDEAAKVLQLQIDETEDENIKRVFDSVAIRTSKKVNPVYQGEANAVVSRLLKEFSGPKGLKKLFTEGRMNIKILTYYVVLELQRKDMIGKKEINDILEAADILTKTGTRDNLILAALVYIRVDKLRKAANLLQSVCILSPKLIPKLVPFIKSLKSQFKPEEEEINEEEEYEEY